MSALLHREKTGQGQFIELSQLEATVNLLGTDILECTANGAPPPRVGNRSRAGRCPHGAFPCQGEDNWIALSVESDDEWATLCGLMGHAAE